MNRLTFGFSFLLLAAAQMQAHADIVTDQSDTAAVTGYYTTDLPSTIGESFTPTLNGLNFAEFFTNYNADYQIGVKVEVLSGAGLGGAVLGTSDNETFTRPSGVQANPPYTNPRPVDFGFSTPVALIPGQTYTLAVLIQDPVPNQQNFFPVGTTGSDTYSGGDRYLTASGANSPQTDDLYFREGLSTLSTAPVPSTLVMSFLTAGTFGLVSALRRLRSPVLSTE